MCNLRCVAWLAGVLTWHFSLWHAHSDRGNGDATVVLSYCNLMHSPMWQGQRSWNVKDAANVRRRGCFSKLTSFASYIERLNHYWFCVAHLRTWYSKGRSPWNKGKLQENNRERVCTLFCCQHRLFLLPKGQRKTSKTDVVLHRRVARTYWADMFQRRVEDLCW